MSRAILASIIVLLLLSISSIAGLIQVVKADGGTIYINADGSITPSTAPIHSIDNTYTLTGNITIAGNDGIVIERDNIVLDGAGYTVATGSLGGNGTALTNTNNVTIRNMTVINFTNGIWISYSSDNVLSGNNVANNYNGIMLVNSSNSNLYQNSATNGLYGISLYNSPDNTVSENTVTASTDMGIYLESSNNNVLSGNNATNSGYGIMLYNSADNTLLGNNASANNQYGISVGIYLDSASYSTLSGNNVKANNEYGIHLVSSSNCTLSGNNVASNPYGIYLDSSSDNNVLSGNDLLNNRYGIGLTSYSDNNALSGNNVTANNVYGIVLSNSSNNSIFHNNFVNNTNQVLTDGFANIWNNGSMGNYWGDYLATYPNATQVDSSGVWNTPYVIDANNTDYYPLTVQYAIPEFPSFLTLSLFFMATLPGVIIYKKKDASGQRKTLGLQKDRRVSMRRLISRYWASAP